MDPGTAMLIASGVGLLGNLFGGGQGGQGNQVMPQPVDPEMQDKLKRLMDFWWGKKDQGATPLPPNMPISANWHPNITDSSNIWRAMAGMGGLPSMQGGGGTPFQYGGQMPAPLNYNPGNRVQGNLGGPPRDPYDPRSISRRQLAR